MHGIYQAPGQERLRGRWRFFFNAIILLKTNYPAGNLHPAACEGPLAQITIRHDIIDKTQQLT